MGAVTTRALALKAEAALAAFRAEADLWPEEQRDIDAALNVLRRLVS